MLTNTQAGLYCERGDFHIDPWRPVERAVLTHAHSDHARMGSASYLVTEAGRHIFRERLGDEARIEAIPYGQPRQINDVTVTFFPAGHILGSAQVRVEHRGEVWAVSGDYKVEADETCVPFEPVPCHTFITEATFGLPIYRWRPQGELFAEINRWWRENQQAGRTSVLLAYALGKAQRLLAGVDASIGPIYTHGAVERLNEAYRASGVALPATIYAGDERRKDWSDALLLAPPSAQGSTWLRRFGKVSLAFASGWMALRGTRRRKALDRGFAMSDHADWPQLLTAIEATRAERVFVTHGYAAPLVRWLREKRGLDAQPLETEFIGEGENEAGS